jgi:lipoprotein-releasing system permease protein
MYVVSLILRYLRSKLAPIFAVLAVALCTAMVIIVISIMGGFLEMMEGATHRLEGDIIIDNGMTGFVGYEQLLADLRGEHGVVAGAAPLIETFGLVKAADGLHKVEVMGIDPPTLDQVMDYRGRLYWDPARVAKEPRADGLAAPAGDVAPDSFLEQRDALARGMDLRDLGMFPAPPPAPAETSSGAATSQPLPSAAYQEFERWSRMAAGVGSHPAVPARYGMVLGMEVSRYRRRDSKGQYHLENDVNLGREAVLSVLPLTEQGAFLERADRRLVVVNEFKSGLYEIDANRVYVPFALLQDMLQMQAQQAIDPDTGKPTGRMTPARTTAVLVKGKSGQDLESTKAGVTRIVRNFLAVNPETPPLFVYTWKDKYATFLGAVENEKGMVTFLFGIVSIVAFTMIAVVFYMIVLAKTRDIGTLRAMGASRLGVASIFLGYGLAIGVLGSALGLWAAWEIVHNINEIQDFLGRVTGFQMWRPEVYYFDRIPSQMNPREVAWIVAAAIISSVLGAVIPAIRAARQSPVESLRYE